MEDRLKRIVIKEELWKLTGDHFKAVILNQFIYWSERVNDFDRFVVEERHRMEQEGNILNMEPTNGWIYKSADELIEETMLDISAATMGRHIQTLVDKGYLLWRHNPEHKWDRTKQYRVDFVRVREDLSKLGYSLDGYSFFKLQDASFKMKNGDFKMKDRDISLKDRIQQIERAIPEITTEITSEITPYTHTTSAAHEISEPQQTPKTVCDKISNALGIPVNKRTIQTWQSYADDITILQVVELAKRETDVKNVIGYISAVLRKGYTPTTTGHIQRVAVRPSEPVVIESVSPESKYAAFYAKMPSTSFRQSE